MNVLSITKFTKTILSYILIFVIAFGISFLARSEVFGLTSVKQSSMENTLVEGEKVFINKLAYKFDDPSRGDIIIFMDWERKKEGFWGSELGVFIYDLTYRLMDGEPLMRYVKRVIGVPGDTIDIKGGYVYVNGEKQEEIYIKGLTEQRTIEFPITVPEEALFVLGDNRIVSKDSRVFGFVNYDYVEGKVEFRFYPFDKFGTVQ